LLRSRVLVMTAIALTIYRLRGMPGM
jgi:hypothetical protein